MKCKLCDAANQEFRLIKKTKYCFCIIAKWSLKEGHVMILPIRHVENYSDLNEKESKEIFELVHEISDLIKNKFGENVIIGINKDSHSTQKHVHLHIVPSKGRLRSLISKFENIPEMKDISEEDMNKIKNKILR